MFNESSLKVKLVSGFAMVVTIASSGGFFASYELEIIEKRVLEIVDNRMPSLNSLQIINEAQTAVDSKENYLLYKNLSDENREITYKNFDAIEKRFKEAWKVYEPLPQTKEEEEEAVWKDFVPAWNHWWTQHLELLELARKYQKEKNEQNYDEFAIFATQTISDSFGKAESLLGQLIKINTDAAELEQKSIQNTLDSIKAMLLMLSIFSIILSIVVALYMVRSITKPINHIVGKLQIASDETAAASEQLSTSSQGLAQGASEQASSLQETASTIEELNAMMHRATEGANKASKIATEAELHAKHGKKAVENVLNSMHSIEESNNKIMEQVKESNQNISEIVQIINEIGSKTKVINDIVFQTKLLSFNASVEAARAGEQGRGFAVVAEEVGHLAQMSGDAAKEIETMLANSITKVESIVSDTKNQVDKLIVEGKNKIEIGKKMVESSDKILDDIVSGASEVTRVAQDVSHASDQQSQGIAEITNAINQLDQVTQENASTSEEAASAADKLTAQAIELKESVNELIHLVEGKNTKKDYTLSAKQSHKLSFTPVVKDAVSIDSSKYKQKKNIKSKLAKAVGSEPVPSASDNRFEEV